MSNLEEKVDVILTTLANQKQDIDEEIRSMIALKINQRDNLEQKIERVLALEDKMKYIIELLEKQNNRAKLGMLWKFVMFIFVFVVPSYLSYKMLSNFDTGSLMQYVKEFKSMVP